MAKRSWFTVEIIFTAGTETKRYCFKNCDHAKVKALREALFFEGIQMIDAMDGGLPIEYVVILPWNVKDFRVFLQEKFFYNEQSDLKQTVFAPQNSVKP